MTEAATRKTWPPKDRPMGLTCPRCGCADLRVRNTRHSQSRIVRYRECRHCGKYLTTYEVTPAMLAGEIVR